MSDEPNWKAVAAERTTLVERVLSQPFADAWAGVRSALSEMVPLIQDEPGLCVYTGPTRSFLLPLPWELLRGFLARFGAQALDALYACSGDPNPVLSAYALYALDKRADPRFAAAAKRVEQRSEVLCVVFGCFVQEFTLVEYAAHLIDDPADSTAGA